MNKKIQLSQEKVCRGEIIRSDSGETMLSCPKEGPDILIYSRDSKEAGHVLLEQAGYLVFTARVAEENSMCFQLSFFTGADEDNVEEAIRIVIGQLPGVEVTVPVDLALLNSQKLFVERTPGRLKMVVMGKPVHPQEVRQIRLRTIPYYKEFCIGIKEIYLTDKMPSITLPDIKLMDEIGQWIPKKWDKKAAGREECSRILRELLEGTKDGRNVEGYQYDDWDSYGGWKKKQLKKTGWFHTEYDGERWWLADPEGNAFISIGLDCIDPGTETRIDPVQPWLSFVPDSDEYAECTWSRDSNGFNGRYVNYGIVNLISAFGPDRWREAWAGITKRYLMKWGINTIGNWSDIGFIRYAKMPYVLPIDEYAEHGYPRTSVMIFRDFPDVFSDEYKEESMRYAAALEEFRDDPYMIGYFMRNEPEWAFVYGINIAECMLANPCRTASREVFVRRMREKYETIDRFNEAWKLAKTGFDELYQVMERACEFSEAAKSDLEAFSKEMITLYVEIPAKALRKVDPNHMNLGMRYAFISDPVLLSGYENFDVFSINSYQMSPYEQIQKIGEALNMPVMIGEFHFGALDGGMTAHGIRGVHTQAERGKAYRYYVEQGALSPYYTGAHYFLYNDQSCMGRFDGENYQIGLIDICMQEYEDMTDVMEECHRTFYETVAGIRTAFDEAAEEVEAIHY